MPLNIAGQVLADQEYVTNPALQTVLLAAAKNLVQLSSVALSPAAVAANTTAEQSLVVATPVGATDLISVQKPSAQAGLAIGGWRIIDATHVGVNFVNDTGASITPTAAETYVFMWRGYNA